ncbi:hypothetical protein BCBD1442_22360 [Brucella ceti]|nr:hypothetical protein BCBD1442_22360 [Brucella ceti]
MPGAPELARRAEDAGIAMVTVHGRTRCQFYEGTADWDAIHAVRDAVRESRLSPMEMSHRAPMPRKFCAARGLTL